MHISWLISVIVFFMSYFLISAAGDLYTWGWGMFEFEVKLTHNSFDTLIDMLNLNNVFPISAQVH